MKIVKTDMICSVCGEVLSIQRKIGRQKKSGHIKDLWCPICEKRRKFIELKDKDIYYYKLLYKNNKTDLEQYVFDMLDKRKELDNYEEKQYRNR